MEWEELVRSASTNGIFGIMFIWILKKYFEKIESREKIYDDMIRNNEKNITDFNNNIDKLKTEIQNIEKKVELNNVYNMKSFNSLKTDIADVIKEFYRKGKRDEDS